MKTNYIVLSISIVIYMLLILTQQNSLIKADPTYGFLFQMFASELLVAVTIFILGKRIIQKQLTFLVKKNILWAVATSTALSIFEFCSTKFLYNSTIQYFSEILMQLLLVFYYLQVVFLLRLISLDYPKGLFEVYFILQSFSLLIYEAISEVYGLFSFIAQIIVFGSTSILFCICLYFLYNCQDYFSDNHKLFSKDYVNTEHKTAYSSAYGELYAENIPLKKQVKDCFNVDEILEEVQENQLNIPVAMKFFLGNNGIIISVMFSVVKFYFLQVLFYEKKINIYLLILLPIVNILIYSLFLKSKAVFNKTATLIIGLTICVVCLVLQCLIEFGSYFTELVNEILQVLILLLSQISSGMINSIHYYDRDDISMEMKAKEEHLLFSGFLTGQVLSSLIFGVVELIHYNCDIIASYILLVAIIVAQLFLLPNVDRFEKEMMNEQESEQEGSIEKEQELVTHE